MLDTALVPPAAPPVDQETVRISRDEVSNHSAVSQPTASHPATEQIAATAPFTVPVGTGAAEPLAPLNVAGFRIDTKVLAVGAALALVLAATATAAAAGMWHRTATLSREVAATGSVSAGQTATISELELQVADLTAQMAALEQAHQVAGSQLSQVAGLLDRLGTLEANTTDLAVQLAGLNASGSDFATLRDTVNSLSSQVQAARANVAALCEANSDRRGRSVCD